MCETELRLEKLKQTQLKEHTMNEIRKGIRENEKIATNLIEISPRES